MTINTSSFFMQIRKPYAVPYTLFLVLIVIGTVYIFIPYYQSQQDIIHPAVFAYLTIKGFLVFGNFTLPFKYFNYNPIIFKTLINLGFGVLLAFLYLQLYNEPLLTILDCGLSLITVFSLMKMHQSKNVQ